MLKINFTVEPEYMHLDHNPLIAAKRCLVALKTDSDSVDLLDYLFDHV